MSPTFDVRARILASTQEIVQHHGYNGFNYFQVADRCRIGVEGIGSCFPRKADLAAAVAARYHASFMSRLEAARAEVPGSFDLLGLYAGMFRQALVEDARMCLCGMLSAEISTLPDEVRNEVRLFFDANLVWLASVLSEGKERCELFVEGSIRTEANLILATLEGAMLVARSTGFAETFDDTVATFLVRYRTPTSALGTTLLGEETR